MVIFCCKKVQSLQTILEVFSKRGIPRALLTLYWANQLEAKPVSKTYASGDLE